jgi:hypothetical protein
MDLRRYTFPIRISRRRGPRVIGGLAATLCAMSIAAMPSRAEASLTLAAEAGPAIVLSPRGPDSNIGFNAAGRIGYRLGLPLLKLTPEVKIAVDTLPLGTDTRGLRAMVGARVTLGEILSPVAFAHFGFGSLRPAIGETATGSAFDIGAGLDFTLLPLIDIGAFISYNRIDVGPRTHWMVIGAQATLVL